MEIPKIQRYNMDTNHRSSIVDVHKNPKGDWVRYEDVKWMIYLLNKKDESKPPPTPKPGPGKKATRGG